MKEPSKSYNKELEFICTNTKCNREFNLNTTKAYANKFINTIKCACGYKFKLKED